jgi:serine/threonine protein kinase
MAARPDMTQTGMRCITLRYASTEHIRNDAFSTASDVYSLGMMLYGHLSGHLPQAWTIFTSASTSNASSLLPKNWL